MKACFKPAMTAGKEERRSKPRIYESFPATVRGRRPDGATLLTETFLHDMSASGLYLKLPHNFEQCRNVLLLVRLSTAASPLVRAACVALRGRVLRTEPEPNGTCGLAVALTRFRFL